MKLIASKYKSHCGRCGKVVIVGENVYWEKSKGVIHVGCYGGEIPAESQQNNNIEKKNYFFLSLRMYMFLAPLFYGPVYEINGMKDAIAYCMSFPLIIAILTGLKPTGLRVRVKWSSRRALQGDIFATFVLLEVAFSFGITWLLKSLVLIVK